MCGRCFDDAAVAALAGAGGFPALTRLCLSGAYRLSDAALGLLLAACPSLRALELPQNCQLSSAGIDSIVRHCGSSLVALSLGACEQLSAEALSKLTALCKLQALDLSGLPNLTDVLLAGVLQRCGARLQSLSIADCEGLTAEGAVAAISSFCGGSLAALTVGCNPAVTSDCGPLTVLFEDAAAARADGTSSKYSSVAAVSNGSSSEHFGSSSSSSSSGGGSSAEGSSAGGSSSSVTVLRGHPCAELHTLSIRSLRAAEGRGGDAATIAMAQACAGTLRTLDLCGSDITDATLVALAQHCSSSLVTLDLSFCRSITNQGLGHLVDRCDKLRSLLLWGNIHIGDDFLKRHSNERLHVVKA
jgi:Leucine Rich repeat